MLGGGVICSYLNAISTKYTYRHPSGCAYVHSFQLGIQDIWGDKNLGVQCSARTMTCSAITAMRSVADLSAECNVIHRVGG